MDGEWGEFGGEGCGEDCGEWERREIMEAFEEQFELNIANSLRLGRIILSSYDQGKFILLLLCIF